MEKFEYYERVKPLIESAAQNAKRRASTVGANLHFLWGAYQQEKQRLHFAAWSLKDKETVKPDRFSDEMTREEFEQYLLNLAVWVEEDYPAEDQEDSKRI